MAANKETYKGNYQVQYISGRASDNGKVQIAEVEKIRLLGPPFCALCFNKKKDKQPILIVPVDRVLGIYFQDKKGHLQQTSIGEKLR